MSLEAMVWALKLTPDDLGDVSPSAHLTLIALANNAQADGRNAFPAASTLAEIRSMSVRNIRRHLAALEAQGLIRRGDQDLVKHLREGYRPVVYDLALAVDNSQFRGDTDVTPLLGRGDISGPSGVTPDVLQNRPRTYVSSTYSSTDARGDFSTGPDESTADDPTRDCLHGHPAVWFTNRRRHNAREPKCPECRRYRRILWAPQAVTA